MATCIARAEIHRTIKPGKAATATSPAVRPEIEVIKPGTRFVAEGQFLADLIKGRAVEVVGEDAPAGEVKAATPAAAKTEPEPTKKATRRTSKPKPETKPETETTDAGGDDNGSTESNGGGDDGADTETDLV